MSKRVYDGLNPRLQGIFSSAGDFEDVPIFTTDLSFPWSNFAEADGPDPAQPLT